MLSLLFGFSVEARNGVGLPVGNVVVATIFIFFLSSHLQRFFSLSSFSVLPFSSNPTSVGRSSLAMELCRSRPGGVGLGLEVVEPCRI